MTSVVSLVMEIIHTTRYCCHKQVMYSTLWVIIRTHCVINMSPMVFVSYSNDVIKVTVTITVIANDIISNILVVLALLLLQVPTLLLHWCYMPSYPTSQSTTLLYLFALHQTIRMYSYKPQQYVFHPLPQFAICHSSDV